MLILSATISSALQNGESVIPGFTENPDSAHPTFNVSRKSPYALCSATTAH